MGAQSGIDLVSTAGMRIIRLADPIIAGEMIGNLTQQLQLLANKTAPGMTAIAAIMEGEDEALAGWVTAVKLTDGEPGIQGKTSQELHASQGDDVEWPPFLPRDKRSIY